MPYAVKLHEKNNIQIRGCNSETNSEQSSEKRRKFPIGSLFLPVTVLLSVSVCKHNSFIKFAAKTIKLNQTGSLGKSFK